MKLLRTSAVVAATLMSGLTMSTVSADSVNLLPLEINPVCADASTNLAYWNVYNKNSVNVNINYNAKDNGHTGSYNAPNGTTQFSTYYDPSDPNNTTSFSDVADPTPVQRNSSNTACQPGQVTIANTGNNGYNFSSGNGPTGTTSSTGTTNAPAIIGGRGGGVIPSASTTSSPVVTAPAPQLAYTGASTLVPYTAAAIIAMFTAGTSVLVRKNVL